MSRRNSRFLFRAILFLVIFAVLTIYVGWNGSFIVHEWFPSIPLGLYWVLYFIFAFAYLLGRIPIRPKPLFRALKVAGSYYIGMFEYAVLLLPLADLAGWVLHAQGMSNSRIADVVGITTLSLFLLLFIWGTRNAWSPVVRTYELDINKQAGDIGTMDVVMISDLHLGNIVGNRHLDRLLPKVEAIKPDLILLAGDVLDDVIEPFLRNRMGEKLKQLKARWGVYAVLGNHEYYGGHIDEYVEKMKEIGIPVLQDERALPGGVIQLAGRKDKSVESASGRLPIGELLAGFDRSKPIFVMDHQPYGYDAAAEAGTDVLVSGHTHRGQFAPNHLITRRLFELDWGYLRKGSMHAIVSSGFGTWGPPIRLASRSEIIHLKIRFTGGRPVHEQE